MRYLLVQGEGQPLFVHARCEDELLAKSELLLFAAEASRQYPGRPVVGSYDVEPAISIGDMQRAYRSDPEGYQRILQYRQQILRHGWTFKPWQTASET